MTSIDNQLGGNPIKTTLIASVLFIMIGAAIIVGLIALSFRMSSGLVTGITMALSLCYIIGLFAVFIGILKSLINLGVFIRAKSTVANQGFNVTWVARGAFCDGILVVDEESNKIYIGDGVFNFDDVRNTEWNSNGKSHCVEVTLRAGNMPIRRVWLDSADDAKITFARLNNTLKLSVNASEKAESTAL